MAYLTTQPNEDEGVSDVSLMVDSNIRRSSGKNGASVMFHS